jgi:hypothetical protein
MITRFDEPLSNHEAHEGHEGSGNYYISTSSFVLFATFVVIMSVSILVATQPRCVLRGEIDFSFGCGSAGLG